MEPSQCRSLYDNGYVPIDNSSARPHKGATLRKWRRILRRRVVAQNNNVQNATRAIRGMDLREPTWAPPRRWEVRNTFLENEMDSSNDDGHRQGDSLVRRLVVDVEHDATRAGIQAVREDVARLPAEQHRGLHLVRRQNLIRGFYAVGRGDLVE